MEVQTACGLFTSLKPSKAGNSTLVIANGNSPGGQRGGEGFNNRNHGLEAPVRLSKQQGKSITLSISLPNATSYL